MSTINDYLAFLWNSLQFDIQVYSKAWLYYWVLIPAIGYFIFFIFKWIVLTIPLWMPIAVILRLVNIPSPRCKNCAYKTTREFENCTPEEGGKACSACINDPKSLNQG